MWETGDQQNDHQSVVEDRAKQYAKTRVQQAVKKAAVNTVKAGAKLVGKAITALVSMVSLPVIVIGIVMLVTILFFANIYWAMPENSMLSGTKMEQTEYDKEIKAVAEQKVYETNILNTYLVPGEGNYYPAVSYKKVGAMADKYGQDARIANQWGDGYAPVLWKAHLYDDDPLEDKNWVEREMASVADSIKPYFYYKESTVTVTDEEESYSYSVQLMVEAYTIRGHNLYSYEQVTDTSGNNSITYEKLKNVTPLSDGKNYLKKGLEKHLEKLGLDSEDEELTIDLCFESMQAFTAQAQWLEFLSNNGYSFLRTISVAQVPAEYRGFVDEAAQITGLPESLLMSIISKESSWNPMAINSSTGCFGLTQLNPLYWDAWAERYGFDPDTDKWNPRAQIIIGAQVLRGYMSSLPNFNDDNWTQDSIFRAAMARYGGYGDDVDKASAYINDITTAAKLFESRDIVWPVPSRGRGDITSFFCRRIDPTGTGKEEDHPAIDIAANTGETVVSASAGVVQHAGWGKGYGMSVWISDGTYTYIYGHLSATSISAGDAVYPGLPIGQIGSTGRSTGPHLHFEIRIQGVAGGYVDPLMVCRF